MAWNLAAYAIAFAVLLAAGALVALLWRLNRMLGRWDRKAERLARQADQALAAYSRLAEEAAETAAVCKQTMSGFSRLAEGARAVGEAAESAAMAAVHAAEYWHDRLISLRSADGGTAAEVPGLIDYVRDLGRRIFAKLAADSDPGDGFRPGTGADHRSGE